MYKNKYKRTRMMTKIITGTIITLSVVGIGALSILPHFTKNTYEVTVTEKQVKRSDDSDKYLIFTQLSDGNVRVFENTDSLIEGKFNSSDVYAKLKENKKYQIKTYGWRIPYLSSYENIINVEEVT
jgi:hypothetical protein